MEVKHSSHLMSSIWCLQWWDAQWQYDFIWFGIFSKSWHFSMTNNELKWGMLYLGSFWIVLMNCHSCQKRLVQLTTAACMYHEDMGSDHLLVDSNVVEKAMHVGDQGLNQHHILQCFANKQSSYIDEMMNVQIHAPVWMVVHTNDKVNRVEWLHDKGFDARQHYESKATQQLFCLELQVIILGPSARFVHMIDGYLTIHKDMLIVWGSFDWHKLA